MQTQPEKKTMDSRLDTSLARLRETVERKKAEAKKTQVPARQLKLELWP